MTVISQHLFGVHRSRLRYYDAGWVTLPNLSFFIINRRSTEPGPTPSVLLALPLGCFGSEPTNMWDIFAAAMEVMRTLGTASTTCGVRSGPTLGPECLAADRPKTDFGGRHTHTHAYSQCCRMTHSDALGRWNSSNEAPCSCAHAAIKKDGKRFIFCGVMGD